MVEVATLHPSVQDLIQRSLAYQAITILIS